MDGQHATGVGESEGLRTHGTGFRCCSESGIFESEFLTRRDSCAQSLFASMIIRSALPSTFFGIGAGRAPCVAPTEDTAANLRRCRSSGLAAGDRRRLWLKTGFAGDGRGGDQQRRDGFGVGRAWLDQWRKGVWLVAGRRSCGEDCGEEVENRFHFEWIELAWTVCSLC